MLILSILKGIGLILLFLFLLLLLLLLLFLFVPIRYRIDGSLIEEKPDGTVQVSWLCHFVTGELTYRHGVCVSGFVRVLGMTVFRIEGLPDEE